MIENSSEESTYLRGQFLKILGEMDIENTIEKERSRAAAKDDEKDSIDNMKGSELTTKPSYRDVVVNGRANIKDKKGLDNTEASKKNEGNNSKDLKSEILNIINNMKNSELITKPSYRDVVVNGRAQAAEKKMMVKVLVKIIFLRFYAFSRYC